MSKYFYLRSKRHHFNQRYLHCSQIESTLLTTVHIAYFKRQIYNIINSFQFPKIVSLFPLLMSCPYLHSFLTWVLVPSIYVDGEMQGNQKSRGETRNSNLRSFPLKRHIKQCPFLMMATANHSWISCLLANRLFLSLQTCSHLRLSDTDSLPWGLHVLSRCTMYCTCWCLGPCSWAISCDKEVISAEQHYLLSVTCLTNTCTWVKSSSLYSEAFEQLVIYIYIYS